MNSYGFHPDEFTFTSILSACACLEFLEVGRQLHSVIIKNKLAPNLFVGNALVDMYAKSGNLHDARQQFELVKNKDNVSWNAIIVGLTQNDSSEEALQFYQKMHASNFLPDQAVFVCVLKACSHAGMVSEGRQIFNLMVNQYEIQPRIDHCACMVDLLGRWGFLEEAEEFISTFNLESDAKIWATMLGACRTHGDEGRGQRAAEKLIELEPQNSSPYVLLSNIHAASGNWDEVRSLRRSMKEKGVKKLPGCSWITVGQTTSFFVAGEISHSRAGDIGSALRDLMALMKDLCDIDSFYNVEDLSSG
ncbi:unnamed protein product [Linum tenue]|uniref:Pentatricopeptide repeat-containing protein n=1 Tax=Linum tenue TaxID=586396 RepID=A0AAV0QW61_9ROSI|nr:unnamed protein product [Linum tenue]